MEFWCLFIGILIPILYLYIETWTHYGFELFAYNFGINIKLRKLKTEIKTFEYLKDIKIIKNGLIFKFISKDTCLVRGGEDDVPLIFMLRPIPIFNYKIKILNNKCIIFIKYSYLYLLLIGFIIYEIIVIIINKKFIYNEHAFIIFLILLSLFIFILSLNNTKNIGINLLKIIKENSLK